MPLVALACLALALSGCGVQKESLQVALDTPQYHAAAGRILLQADKYADALREFQRAQTLAPRYAPAYAGLGILASLNGNCPGGFAMLEQGLEYARDKNEEAEIRLGFIRAYAECRDKLDANWLSLAEKEYEKFSEIAPQSTALVYHMGKAYKNAGDFSSAKKFFGHVREVSQDKSFNAKAKMDLAHMKRTEKAGPLTQVGKSIALLPSVTRAELSALLVREMGAERFVPRRTAPVFAADVSGHPFQGDMEAVMSLELDSLQPYPDRSFRPDETVTRCQFATVMEEILLKALGVGRLDEQAWDGSSSFSDLPDHADCLKPMTTATRLGLLEKMDRLTRMIGPEKPITGVDALFGVKAAERHVEREAKRGD